MASITLRSVKGTPLTNTEVDNNFSNINTELGQKAPLTGTGATGTWNIDISGKANAVYFADTRSVNDQPQGKLNYSLTADFKLNSSVSSPPVTANGSYSHIVTVAGWNTGEGSGGWPSQLSIADGIAVRQATNATTWGTWKTLLNSSNYNNYALPLTGGTLTGALRVDGNTIRQGNNLARPLAEWSASGSSTGMVYIELPGTTSNYGMIHAVIDLYEYDGNAACTIIVGGHNWSTSWYNTSCDVIGSTNKPVRLAVRNGKFVICIGTASSTWTYGTVMLRKIHNASFYNNIIDMGATFVIAQTTSEELSGATGDLRATRLPSVTLINSNQVLHAANYNSYSPTLTGTGASGNWNINITGNAATVTDGVYLSGTQTITGNKTFSGSVGFSNTINGSISGNAATVGTLGLPSTAVNNEANKIVRTDGSGYIQAGWINTISGDNGTTTMDRVYASSDGYIRYYTPANFRTVLDVPTRGGSGASGNWNINITGNAATATTAPSGTNRGDQIHGTSGVTLATSFASIPSGMSGFTDNWSTSDLPSGMGHVQGIAVRHFNNTSNSWGWHIVGQYDIPGDLRVRWVNASTWTQYYQLLSNANYSNYALPLSGGTLTGHLVGTTSNFSGGFANNDNGIRIANPGGASFSTQASTVTGAIKIRIPAAALGSNSMISFRVRVYQYSTGLTQEFIVAGYNYNDVPSSWINVSALNLCDAGTDYTVRFGKDATSQCIYIGELNSTWSYPQVHVLDFSAGYSNTSYSTWATGWNISFESTAFAGVTASRIASRQLHASNYNSYSPTLTGTGASGTWNISISGGLTGTNVDLGYSLSAQTINYGGQGGPQIRSQGGGAAMISFHRPGAYAVNFGLDSDNVLKVGGWSMGAAYTVYHSGLFSYSSNVAANHVVQRDVNGYIYANYINFNHGTDTGTIANCFYDNGDGWLRKTTKAHFISQLNITGTPALNIVTGATQTAVAGNHYVLTNAAVSTLTLPASPSAGDVVWVGVGNNRADNIIARNGQNIMGLAEDMTIDNVNATVQLRFANSTLGWRLI